jgi:hypothetical protein
MLKKNEFGMPQGGFTSDIQYNLPKDKRKFVYPLLFLWLFLMFLNFKPVIKFNPALRFFM